MSTGQFGSRGPLEHQMAPVECAQLGVGRWKEGLSWGLRFMWPLLIAGEEWRVDDCNPQKSNPQHGFPVTFCKGLRKIWRRGPKCKRISKHSFVIFCAPVVISGQSLEGKGQISSTLVQPRNWGGWGGTTIWLGKRLHMQLPAHTCAFLPWHLLTPVPSLKCLTFSLSINWCNKFLLNAYKCQMLWTQSKSQIEVCTVIKMVWYIWLDLHLEKRQSTEKEILDDSVSIQIRL